MAVLRPWIQPFLCESLDHYLVSEGVEHDLEDNPNYEYNPQVSNLHIFPKYDFSEHIIVVKVAERSENGFKALVADGCHKVRASYFRRRQYGEDDNPQSTNSIAEGAFITATRAEFRVSRCFDPAEVELVFDIAQSHDQQTNILELDSQSVPICDEVAVKKLLVHYTRLRRNLTTDKKIMAIDASIASQPSKLCLNLDSNGNTEDPQPTQLAQSGFATQFHVTQREGTHRETPQEPSQTPLSTQPGLNQTEHQIEDDNTRLLQLIRQERKVPVTKHISGSIKRDHNHELSTSSTDASNNEQVHPGGSIISNQNVRTAHTANILPLHVNKVPRDLMPPTGTNELTTDSLKHTQPVENATASPRNVSGGSSEDAGILENSAKNHALRDCTKNAAAMPNDLMLKFRRWRLQALAGRYVPRYVTKIPPKQKQILDGDNCYHPCIIGKQSRPGDVPIDLFTHLTTLADMIPVALPGTRQECTTGVDVGSFANDDADSAPNDDSSDSSEEVSREMWPDSPATHLKRTLLPPDSPTAASANSPHFQSPGRAPAQVQHMSQDAQVSSQQHSSAVQSSVDRAVTGPVSLSSQATPSSQQNVKEQYVEPSPCPSAAISDTEVIHNKRTPYPNRDNKSKKTPFSLGENTPSGKETMLPMSSFVPGTYQTQVEVSSQPDIQDHLHGLENSENGKMKSKTDNPDLISNTSYEEVTSCSVNAGSVPEPTSINESLSQPSLSKHYGNAKPVILDRGVAQQSESMTLIHEREAALLELGNSSIPLYQDQETPDLREENHVLPTSVELESKTRAPSDTDRAETSTKAKRFAVRGTVDPAYAPVMLELHKYRKTVLLPLCKSNDQPGSAPNLSASNTKPDTTSTRTTLANVESNDEHRNADLGADTSTQICGLPNQKGANHSASESLVNIFKDYQIQYSDYGGNETQFAEACDLLERLQELDQAPHPFLYDDFIFHHYHNYQLYLSEAAKADANVIPYRKYYSTKIKVPTHTTGVLTPETICTMQMEMASDTPKLHIEQQPALVTTMSSEEEEQERTNNSNDNDTTGSTLVHEPSPLDNVKSLVQQDDQEHSADESLDSLPAEPWLEKAVGAESPELGTPDVVESSATIPHLDLPEPLQNGSVAVKKNLKRKSRVSFVTSLTKSKKSKKWWEEKETPFKKFTRQFGGHSTAKDSYSFVE